VGGGGVVLLEHGSGELVRAFFFRVRAKREQLKKVLRTLA